MSSYLQNGLEFIAKEFNDEGISTITSEEQIKVEQTIKKIYQLHTKRSQDYPGIPRLLRLEHSNFLINGLKYLPGNYACLDASRTWICYWIVHSLSLLDVPIDPKIKSNVAKFLGKCQTPEGGFGGGPGQYAHLAPTYGAILTLCTLGTEEAYNIINREGLQRFLWKVRSEDGAFAMHEDGEVDVRGAYCALVVAKLTKIYTDDLFEGTAEWIVSCQTYEGGFSGIPGMEAHGGYTFCSLAALEILGKTDLCNLRALLRWAAFRQMRLEGGFQGRTNKLVDNCYSFWQGSIFVMMQRIMEREDGYSKDLLMNQAALQEYILICCQHVSGGLFDKPGKPRDAYHTCYGLSGLSIAQTPKADSEEPFLIGPTNGNGGALSSNKLVPTDPCFNVVTNVGPEAIRYFESQPVITIMKQQDIIGKDDSSEESEES